MTEIALALGAGGARGLAHIHALQAFDELGIKPSVIAGTSIGSSIGAGYCSGMTGIELAEYVISSLENRANLISKAVKLRPRSLAAFMADGGFRVGELNLETIFSVFLPDQVPETFEELSIPLHIVATDFYAEDSKVFSTGPLRKVIAASSAMPAVFLPVEIEGRYYIDGSSTNPCPIDLLACGTRKVIAIDVSGGTQDANQGRPSKINTMYASSQIMQQTIVRQMMQTAPNTALLRPPVNSYRSLDFFKASEILEATAPLKDQVKQKITEFLG